MKRAVFSKRPSQRLNKPVANLLLLFGIEGVLFQFFTSVKSYGDNLYATNLGATDTQIGLIHTIPSLVAIVFLLIFGFLADKARSTKTIPMLLLAIMGVSYLCMGLVPELGTFRMFFYFLFLGLGAGSVPNYNAQWQLFFGKVTSSENRNDVYATRNRFMFFIGTLIPLLCGAIMSTSETSEEKLGVLQIFYFLAGALLFLQIFIIWKIPGGVKSNQELALRSSFHWRTLSDTLRFMVTDSTFRNFLLCILLFHATHQIDFSMFYLTEIQYMGMEEMHLGMYSAMVSIMNLLTIGIFARMNKKYTVNFTFLFAVAGLCFCPISVMVSALIPLPVRPWFFILLTLVGAFPQGCIGLCTVQMLLDVLPEKNRSLVTNLYTIVITLSSSLMPLLGVRIYTLLGADRTALILFYLLVLVLRLLTLTVFLRRWRKIRSAGLQNDPKSSITINSNSSR